MGAKPLEIYSYNSGVPEESYWSIKAPESKELDDFLNSEMFNGLSVSVRQAVVDELRARLNAPVVQVTKELHQDAWALLKKLDARANATRSAARAVTKELAAKATTWEELEELRAVTEMTHGSFSTFLEGGKRDEPVELASELKKKLAKKVEENKSAYQKRQAAQ